MPDEQRPQGQELRPLDAELLRHLAQWLDHRIEEKVEDDTLKITAADLRRIANRLEGSESSSAPCRVEDLLKKLMEVA